MKAAALALAALILLPIAARAQVDERVMYASVVDGKGAPGFLKGSGDLDLQQEGNLTKVNYTADVQVGGTIASVGQRMIQGTAKMMAAQFFTCLGAEAKTDVGEPPPQHGFFRTALRWFSGFLKRLVRKN